MDVLAVIPARGNSKRLPNKNLAKIAGTSLVAHAITLAKQCTPYVVVISENEEILQEAIDYEVEIIKRPEKLATDESKVIDSWLYALNKAELLFRRAFLNSVLLEPTSPLREPDEVEGAIALSKNYDSVWTVSRGLKYHPDKAIFVDFGRIRGTPFIGNEQELMDVYFRNGVAYVNNTINIRARRLIGNNPGAYLCKGPKVSIDTQEDLDYARYLYALRSKSDPQLG